jgi:chorismate-pyruvate lyase
VASTVLKKGDCGSMMLQKISQLESRSGIKLGFAQKILLAETGTVEQVLSILTGSAVTVKVVKQKENARTITRESIITSKDTGKALIRAHSKIFSSCLPPKVLSQIKQKQSGIGTIIYSFGLETFRKITEVGYDPESRSVFRKYQIIYRGKVAFVIKEELLIEESSGPGGI